MNRELHSRITVTKIFSSPSFHKWNEKPLKGLNKNFVFASCIVFASMVYIKRGDNFKSCWKWNHLYTVKTEFGISEIHPSVREFKVISCFPCVWYSSFFNKNFKDVYPGMGRTCGIKMKGENRTIVLRWLFVTTRPSGKRQFFLFTCAVYANKRQHYLNKWANIFLCYRGNRRYEFLISTIHKT